MGYGGKFLDKGGHGEPEFGTNKPQPITADDHYKACTFFTPSDGLEPKTRLKVGSVWRSLGLDSDPAKERDWVKPGKTFRLERRLEKDQRLGWQFFMNGEMSFRVLRCDGSSFIRLF